MSVNPFPNPYPQPTPQLTYQANFNQPLPGVIADGSEFQEKITGLYPAGYAIFGTLMAMDASLNVTGASQSVTNGANTYTSPPIGGGIGQGVTYATGAPAYGWAGMPIRTGAMESRRDLQPPSYAPNDTINILRAGRAWTAPEVNVTQHDPVYVRTVANGSLNTLGALRNDADTSNAVVATGAKWLDSALAGQPARIEFNFLGL